MSESMWIRLDDDGSPRYRQLYQSLRRAILEGFLKPGSRLPSTRRIAREVGVSRNVVLLAFDQLMAEGYAEGRVGSGTFVASQLPEPAALAPLPAARTSPPAKPAPRLSSYGRKVISNSPVERLPNASPRYDFRYGRVVSDRHGLNEWRRLLARHAEQPALNYAPAEGHPRLREVLAEYVARSRAVQCGPEQVIVVNGSQQALDLTVRILLEPGERVLIEEPHYRGARQVFLAAGADLVACPVDDDGLDVGSAPVEAHGARLAYVTPSHQFPTGAVMPLPRRLALLEWAERQGAYILEDDYDSEYRYEGRPVEAVYGLDRVGRTVYVGTFSKVLSPAVRLGFVVLPQELIEPFAAAKWLADRHTATLDQAVLADFIAGGHFERHLRRMRTQNAARRAALLESLDEHFGDRIRVTGTNAGIHLLVWLPDMSPDSVGDLIAGAAAEDVGVYPVSPLFLASHPPAGLLLGYAALSEEEIREGVRRLAAVVRRVESASEGITSLSETPA